MKRLGKLSLKQMEQEMPLLKCSDQVLLIGGSGFPLIDFGGTNQAIGEAVMGALRAYDQGGIWSLNELCDYTTFNGGSGMGDSNMHGTFSFNGHTFSWYVSKPPEQYRDICGPDQNYGVYGDDFDGYFSIESCHQERNVIVIRCTSEEAWNDMYHYIND